MTVLSEPSSCTVVICCHTCMPKCMTSAHQTHGVLPTRTPKNKLSLCKGTLKCYLLLRQLRKPLLPVEGCISLRENTTLSLKALKNPWGFQEKKFSPAASSVLGQCRCTRKWRFAPPWAVQSYSQGCVSPKSWKAEPQVHFPAPVSHLSCPLTPTYVKKKHQNKAIILFPSQTPRKLVWVKALTTWQHECKHTRASW